MTGMKYLIFVALLMAFAQARTVDVIVEFGFSPGLSRPELVKSLRGHIKQLRKLGVVKRSFWSSQSVLVSLPEALVGRLVGLRGVGRVYPNRKLRRVRPVALSKPVGGGSNWALAATGATQLWASGLRGQGVRIGHLDTGVDASHPELQGKVAAFVAVGEDGIPRASQPYDSGGHGTHTAGLLVGNKVGLAPDARLVSALVLPGGSGTLAQVLGGLDWVLGQNVQVVSMSLGLEGTWPEFAPVIERMKQMGVLPVFAIGNSPKSTASPGNLPGVLGVGAVDQNNQVPAFSSHGTVRWAAPYNVVIHKPDLVAPGLEVLSAIPGGGYQAMSGTSVSTAVAAGSAALLLSGGFKSDQVRQALGGQIRLVEALASLRPVASKPEKAKALVVMETPAPELQPIWGQLGAEVLQGSPSQRPSAERITSFGLVVWVLPANWAENWPQAHRQMLRSWVEGGGRLVMITTSSQPAIEASNYGKGKAVFLGGMQPQQMLKIIAPLAP
jgi:serine protease AprX